MEPSRTDPAETTKINLADPSPPWSRISFGPPGPWVTETEFDRALPVKEGWHQTHLLWERQVDAEAETSFHRTAVRLETPLAVQHQSQWRLNLDPRIHHLTLHGLRVVRDGRAIDQLDRTRMRLIQRETQLDHLVIDGQWTLLVVLDDVRPGDVLEAAYSFTGRHPVRLEGCELFFAVPPNVVAGCFRLQVNFDARRPGLKWLASADAPAHREESLADGRTRWSWAGQQLTPREPETNQPSGFMDYIWVQVSDLTDWRNLTAILQQKWEETFDGTDLTQFPGFTRPAEVNAASVLQLVQFIQDEYRYLSVDLESGGWIPMSPTTVARRRYGDCKDLAWLATCILRSWGVPARPILVGSGLRSRIETLLPATTLFNHAVIEVDLGGQPRWFDLTLRSQGGVFTDRCIPWFGFGLPVEAQAGTLLAQPGLRSSATYSVRETIFLDTRRGKASLVEVRLRATGWQADHLRRTRLSQGAEEFAKERLKHAQQRYYKAIRLDSLLWRDHRGDNICEVVESFEFTDPVTTDEGGGRVIYEVPANLAIQSFALPEEKPRRAPWDLPYPFEIRHEIRIHAGGMGDGPRQRRRWSLPEFTGLLDEPRETGNWAKIVRLIIQADDVALDRIPDYRAGLDRFLRASSWRLYLPKDRARPSFSRTPGILPAAAEGEQAYVPAADPGDFNDVTAKPVEAEARVGTPGKKRFWSYRTSGSLGGIPIAVWVGIFFLFSAFARSCSEMSTTNSFAPVDPLARNFPDALPPLRPSESALQDFSAPATFAPPHQKRLLDSSSSPPIPIRMVDPVYPDELRLAGIQGTVVLNFTVDSSGNVINPTVGSSPNPALSEQALATLRQWKFLPGRKDGHPAAYPVQLPVVFIADQSDARKAPVTVQTLTVGKDHP